MVVSMTSGHILIKIKVPNPSQEPPASSKAPNEDLKDMGNLLHLQNLDREPKFRSWSYQRQLTISKSRSRCQTPVRNLQQPSKPQIKNHRFSLLIQNQNRESKFGTLVYQRPLTISKLRSRCQTSVRNLQCPSKPQKRT